jgi:hypothetical protein
MPDREGAAKEPKDVDRSVVFSAVVNTMPQRGRILDGSAPARASMAPDTQAPKTCDGTVDKPLTVKLWKRRSWRAVAARRCEQSAETNPSANTAGQRCMVDGAERALR